MIVPVEKQFSLLEDQRKKLFDNIGKLTHEQQNFRPVPGAWSILQIFNHLITSETNSLLYMTKKIQGIDKVKKAGISAKVRSVALNTFLRLPVKYKAPTVISVKHDDVYIFENITKKWEDQRGQLSIFLDQLDPTNAAKEIFKHPAIGRLNIYQTMSFFTEHVEHHKKQIQRIKASEGFPA